MKKEITDIVIIGAGPVGLFAVFQCGMLDMRCHVIDSLPEIGGQCTALYPEKPIYDIPSHPIITGGELIDKLSAQANAFKPTYHLNQQVIDIKKTDAGWIVTTSKNTIIECKAIIIAAGAGAFGPNKPPLENLSDFENKSVFYMVRQKNDFKGKNIMIAGGGDSAVDWAISLHNIAKSVTVIHRRDKFRALPESISQMELIAKNNPDNFKILTPYQLARLNGNDGVLNSVTLENPDGQTQDINTDCLLAFYGLVPNLGPIKEWGFNIQNNTILVNPSTCETSIPTIFAVGDVAHYEKKLKLILTGFAEVAQAAHHAYTYIHPEKTLHFQYSTTRGLEKT
jgi:thioredoxin reductase (NADPH)